MRLPEEGVANGTLFRVDDKSRHDGQKKVTSCGDIWELDRGGESTIMDR